MLSIRTRIFTIFSIIVLVLLAISLILLVAWKSRGVSEELPEEDGTGLTGDVSPGIVVPKSLVTEVPAGIQVKPSTTEEIEKNAAKQLSKVFIERIASYSTDSNYQNIKDVKELSTSELWVELENDIKDTTGEDMSFVGVTSKVFVSELNEWSGDNASFDLKVLKTEKRNGELTNYSEDYFVEVVKINDKWLVSSFDKK